MLIPLQLEREGRPVRAALAAAFFTEFELLDKTAFFTAAELRTIAEIGYPARRESYVPGRIAAKRAVLGANLYGLTQAAQFEIRKGVFEQPFVFPHTAELSIAHASGAAVALACEPGHPIGVDLELAARTRPDVLAECFTASERAIMEGQAGPVETNYAVGWSMKEALAKALRTGLMTPMSLLEFTPDLTSQEAPFQVTFNNFKQYKALAWRLGQFTLAIALPRRTRIGIGLGPEIVQRFAGL